MINYMIFPAIASFYHVLFYSHVSFLKGPIFTIFDGDDSSLPVADTNI